MKASSDKKLTGMHDSAGNDGRPPLWIHTCSGPQTGFGHLGRCMILADALGELVRPYFILRPRDQWSGGLLREHGCEYVREDFPDVWARLPHPAAILTDTRSGDGRDGREGLAGFVRTAHEKNIPVLSLHDLGLNPLESDIAVDGSIAPSFRHGFGSALTFGGPAYMVLDPTFRELHRRPLPIRREIRSILVSLGGGDAREYFRRVLEGLRLWAAKSERDVEVVATRGFVDWGQERFGGAAAKPLHLRWESRPVGALLRGMRDVDLAITAGGVSAYEALCAGTPLLALSWDSLQQTTIRLIEAAGGCINLGAGNGLLPGHLAEQLEKIDSDAGAREELSRRGMEIVDGRGAERVAAIIRRAIKCGRRDRRGATRVTDDADTGEQSENLLELVG